MEYNLYANGPSTKLEYRLLHHLPHDNIIHSRLSSHLPLLIGIILCNMLLNVTLQILIFYNCCLFSEELHISENIQ